MRTRFFLSVALVGTACLPTSLAAQDASDALQAQTIWKGEIRQGSQSFPTTIYVVSRTNDRVRGEIDFTVPGGGLDKLSFQGNVIEGRIVTWITDKIAGNVTYPGLYFGVISNNSINGTWQVPSAGQYDSFSVQKIK